MMQPYGIEEAEKELRDAIDRDDREAIARLEPIIDALDQPPSIASRHDSALRYAEQGLRVFPLAPGTKIPFKGSKGCLDATTDAAQIAEWWIGQPSANIGIATGHIVDVIDIDGPIGVKSISPHLEEIRACSLGMVSTPRPGGQHWYVLHARDRGNKAGLLPHVDTRGIGGYVCAPPSIITTGEHPGTYSWLRPLAI